jgi:hypothetical protein
LEGLRFLFHAGSLAFLFWAARQVFDPESSAKP